MAKSKTKDKKKVQTNQAKNTKMVKKIEEFEDSDSEMESDFDMDSSMMEEDSSDDSADVGTPTDNQVDTENGSDDSENDEAEDDSENDEENSEKNEKSEDGNETDDTDGDDEESETPVKQKAKQKTKISDQSDSKKANAKTKLPEKNSSSQKRKAGDDGKKPKKKPKLTEITGSEMDEYYRRLDKRNRCTLLIKIKKNTVDLLRVPSVIKEWSADIIDIRLKERSFFIEFGSEKQAENCYKVFGQKKILGHDFILDFVGSKSKLSKEQTKPPTSKAVNKLSLCIEGLHKSTSDRTLQDEFPTATSVKIVKPFYRCSESKTAFLNFSTEELAKVAFDRSANKVINGKPVLVVYASSHPAPNIINVQNPDKPKLFRKKTKQQKLKGKFRKYPVVG